MSEREFDEKLADYLAGELGTDERAAFETLIAADPQRARLVQELRAVEATLRAGLPAYDAAEREARAAASAADVDRTRPAVRRSVGLIAARYAAVIVLAFGAGFMARGWHNAGAAAAEPRVAAPGTPERAQVRSLEEQLGRNYIAIANERPKASSLGRTLLAAARR